MPTWMHVAYFATSQYTIATFRLNGLGRKKTSKCLVDRIPRDHWECIEVCFRLLFLNLKMRVCTLLACSSELLRRTWQRHFIVSDLHCAPLRGQYFRVSEESAEVFCFRWKPSVSSSARRFAVFQGNLVLCAKNIAHFCTFLILWSN